MSFALVIFCAVATPKPVVWVLDGAGSQGGLSAHFLAANRGAGEPFDVRPFAWSHGPKRIAKDQRDGAHARSMGRELAAAVLAEPSPRKIIVAHSAGAAVSLAAAEQLPAGTLERHVLLAPSVTAGYPVAAATLSSAGGMDVFCSRKDVWALGVGVRLFGTADHLRGPGAGLRGFRTAGPDVRQHFWNECWAALGHDGGHYGAHDPHFLRAAVFPLLEKN